MTAIHEGHGHQWVDGLCDNNDCDGPYSKGLDAAWKEAEAAALAWAQGANLYDLTVFRNIEPVGEVAGYTAACTRYEHREPNGPPAETRDAEADGSSPAAALQALAAALRSRP